MRNWKTTLVGAVAAILNAWATGAIDGANTKEWMVSLSIFVLAALAKDYDVSGK